ncbi:hypothetical protein FGB62_13g134 [Gracilaria domingensis]|nr:hypothetical protein FGB62_13g134 [Gracilaria domingensis]
MSRTHNSSEEHPLSLDAWQQHDAFYAKFQTPAVREAIAVARTHLQPIFIENARFSEECGLPTVSVSFLVDNLRESNLIPPLTSHNYKLGLQICISPDLTSPLRSPSKNHPEQRIQFDTFVEAFAFSLFCYPIEQRSAAFSSAPPFGDEQQIECFADNIDSAVHRFIDSSRVKTRHNIETALQQVSDSSENGSLANTDSAAQNSEPNSPNIQEERTGHQTEEQSSEQLPSTPTQRTDVSESDMKNIGRRGGARELHSNYEREHDTSQTPVHFYTPRCNFPAASPRRLPVNSFATTPATLKWFTPRHSIAKLSPDVQKALQMRPTNPLSPNQPLGLSFQNTTTPDVPSLPNTKRELVSYGKNSIPLADSPPNAEAPTVENVVVCSNESTDVGSDEWESSDANVVEEVEESEEDATLSPGSNFQSPELGDGPPPRLQISPEDTESSRKLLFCDSEDEGNISDEGNMSDESSQYGSDAECSTPAFKLSQIEEFGQEIEDPGEVTDFEEENDETQLETSVDEPAFKLSQIEEFGQEIEDPGEVSDFEEENDATQLEISVDEPEVDMQSTNTEISCEEIERIAVNSAQELETEATGAPELDGCIDVTGRSPPAHLSDGGETDGVGPSFDVDHPLIGSVLSPGRSENCRSDPGFDSLGECEQAELLYNCGNLSESSELSMRTRETYSRMLDAFIESGSFGYAETSSNVVSEDGYTALVRCCPNLESLMENASHEEHQEGSFVPDLAPAYRFPEQMLFNRFECDVEEKLDVIDQEPVMEIEARGGGGVTESKHFTDTAISRAPSKTESETVDNHIRRDLPETMDSCCEKIVDPDTCAPLQDSVETNSNQCVSEEAEKGSVASEMGMKSDHVSNNDGLTPDDFDVVRKPIKAPASYDPFSGSPLGSVCTKLSDEHRDTRIHSHTLSPSEHRKSQDRDQDPVPDASDNNNRKEQAIIVQCNSHIGESHILSALRENTELCRMLREEVEARRRSESFCGRLQNFLEGLLILVVVGLILLALLDNWLARAKFSQVLM